MKNDIFKRLKKKIKKTTILLAVFGFFIFFIVDKYNKIENNNRQNISIQNNLEYNSSINGDDFEYNKIPLGIKDIYNNSDLSKNNSSSMNTVSLTNLGEISEIYFEGINNTTAKPIIISEIQLLNSKNENIAFVVKDVSNDDNKKTRETNNKENLSEVLKDQKNDIGSLEESITNKSALVIPNDKSVFFDFSIKLYKPTYLGSINIFSNNFDSFKGKIKGKIRIKTKGNQRWITTNPDFLKSNFLKNMYSIGIVENQPSSWELSKNIVKDYWFEKSNYDIKDKRKGFITIFYKGDFNDVINGTEELEESKISIGSVDGSYDKEQTIIAISDNILISKLLKEKSNHNFFKRLKNDNLLKIRGKSKFIDPNFSFDRKSKNFKKIDYNIPLDSPFVGMINQKDIYIYYEKLFSGINNPMTTIDFSKLIFEYKFQKINGGVSTWNNSSWVTFDPSDYFTKNIERLRISLSNEPGGGKISFNVRVRTKKGYWLNDVNLTQENKIWTDYNFKNSIKEYNFNEGDISFSNFSTPVEKDLSFMGEVEYIKGAIDAAKYSKGMALSELKIFDNKGNGIPFKVVEQKFSDGSFFVDSKHHPEDLKLMTKILTDGISDMGKTVRNMSSEIQEGSFWHKFHHSYFKSKKTGNVLLSTGPYFRLGRRPRFILKLDKPQVIDKIGWMTWGEEQRNPSFTFINSGGSEFSLKSSNYGHPKRTNSDKIKFTYPSKNQTHWEFPYDKNWTFIGTDSNKWNKISGDTTFKKIIPKNLTELGKIRGGYIEIPSFATNRWSKDIVRSFLIYDENGNKIDWKLDQKTVRRPDTKGGGNSIPEWEINNLKSKNTRLDSHGLGWGSQSWTTKNHGYFNFKFKFSDNKFHYIDHIEITTSSVVNNKFFKERFPFVAKVILYGKNDFFELSKFDVKADKAIIKHDGLIDFNIGVSSSTVWKKFNYGSAKLVLDVKDMYWSKYIDYYDLEFFDTLTHKWAKTSDFTISEIYDLKNIKLRIVRKDGGIFHNGDMSKNLNLDLSMFKSGNEKYISADNIDFPITKIKVVGVNNFGELYVPKFKNEQLTLRYKVINKYGQTILYPYPPKNLKNGDEVSAVFFTKSPSDNISKTDLSGNRHDLGNKWEVKLLKVTGLKTNGDINLINEINNINEIKTLKYYDIGFDGSNYSARPSSRFINKLKKINDLSLNIRLILEIRNSKGISKFNLDDFSRITNISSDDILSISLEGVGHQTITYGKNIRVNKIEIISFKVKDVLTIKQPKFLNIDIDEVKRAIDSAISSDISLNKRTKTPIYEFNKKTLIDLSKKYAFKVSLELKSNKKSRNSINYDSLENFPSEFPINHLAIFRITAAEGFAFGDSGNFTSKQQMLVFTKKLSDKNSNTSKITPIIYTDFSAQIIPEISQLINEFGVLKINNGTIREFVNYGYDISIIIRNKRYEIIDGEMFDGQTKISQFIVYNGEKYEIIIKPNKNHFWKTHKENQFIPKYLSKTGQVKNVLSLKNYKNITPEFDISLKGFEGNIMFNHKSINDLWTNINSFDSSKVDFSIAHFEKDFIFDGDWGKIGKYSSANLNGVIDVKNITSNIFNFKNDDWLILMVKNKNSDIFFENFSNSYIKYFKIGQLPIKVEMPEQPQNNTVFEMNPNDDTKEIFGKNINWSDLIKNGEKIKINTIDQNGKNTEFIITESNAANFSIDNIKPKSKVTVEITRNKFIWWGKDISDIKPKSIFWSFIAPGVKKAIYLSMSDVDKKITFKSSIFGAENDGIIRISSINVDDDLLPNNFDWVNEESPWTIVINISNSAGNEITRRSINPIFISKNKIKEFELRNLNIKNGDSISLKLKAGFQIAFGTKASNSHELNFNNKIKVNSLLADFFKVNNIPPHIVPNIKGISGVVTAIGDIFKKFENSNIIESNGIKINITHTDGSKEELNLQKKTLKTPLKNGDEVTLTIIPNHNKFVIDPNKLVKTSTGILKPSSKDIYVKTLVVNNLLNGISRKSISNLENQTNLLEKTYFNDKVLIKSSNKLNELIKKAEKNNLLIVFCSENKSLMKKTYFSSEDLIRGITFSRNINDNNFIDQKTVLSIYVKSKINYKLYDDTDQNNVKTFEQITIFNESISFIPKIIDADVFDNIKISDKERELKNYNLLNILNTSDKDIIEAIKNGNIIFQATITYGTNNQLVDIIKLNYVFSPTMQGVYLEFSGGQYTLKYNLGDISSYNAKNKINSIIINVSIAPKNKNLLFLTRDNEGIHNATKIDNIIDFNYDYKKIEIPTEWKDKKKKIIVIDDSRAKDIKIDFSKFKNVLKKSKDNNFYFSIDVFDENDVLRKTFKDIFDIRNPQNPGTIDLQIIQNKLNELVAKGWVAIIYAEIWQDPKSQGNKTFEELKNNQTSLFKNDGSKVFITEISFKDIRKTIAISNAIINSIQKESVTGIGTKINVKSLETLKSLSNDILVTITITNKNNQIILLKSNTDGKSAFEWLELNSMKLENNQTITIGFKTKVQRDIIKEDNGVGIYHYKSFEKSFVVSKILTPIKMNRLADGDFMLTKKTNGKFETTFSRNVIFNSKWDDVKDQIKITLKVTDAKNNVIGEMINGSAADLDKLLKKINSIGLSLNDKIELKIQTIKGFLLKIDETFISEVNKTYILKESNIIKNKIKIKSIDKLIISKHKMKNGDVSISGFDHIILPHTIDYYNKLGLDVLITIDGKTYKNDKTIKYLSNNQKIVITIVPKDKINNVILLPDGTLTSSESKNFIVQGMKDHLTVQNIKKLTKKGKKNNVASIKMDWLHNTKDIDVIYHIYRKKDKKWTEQRNLPRDLSNGDSIYVVLKSRDGFVLHQNINGNDVFSTEMKLPILKIKDLLNEIFEPSINKIIFNIKNNKITFPSFLVNEHMDTIVKIIFKDNTFIKVPLNDMELSNLIRKQKNAIKIQIIFKAKKGFYFDIQNKINEVKTAELSISPEVIKIGELINISDFKQNSSGDFTFIKNDTFKKISKIAKIRFSINGSRLVDELPNNIEPGSLITFSIEPIIGKAIIIEGKITMDMHVHDNESIIIRKDIPKTILDKLKIIGFDGNATIMFDEKEMEYLNKKHLKIFALVNGDEKNKKIIDKNSIKLNISNSDNLKIKIIPEKDFFFDDGSKKIEKEILVKNLSDKNTNVLYYTLAGILASLVLTWLFIRFYKKYTIKNKGVEVKND